jgi:hypothetical protein
MLTEKSLMSLPSAAFSFTGIDATSDESVCQVGDVLCLFDTCAHITTASKDVLSTKF